MTTAAAATVATAAAAVATAAAAMATAAAVAADSVTLRNCALMQHVFRCLWLADPK